MSCAAKLMKKSPISSAPALASARYSAIIKKMRHRGIKAFFLYLAFAVCLLLMLSGCSGLTEKKADEPADDSSINSTIYARIAADPDLSGLKIIVATKQREVVISGVAPSRELKNRLIKLALGVKGVRSVEDRIMVRKK